MANNKKQAPDKEAQALNKKRAQAFIKLYKNKHAVNDKRAFRSWLDK